MNILGLNYFFHDSTACIVSDGRLVTAIEEERLTRKKHTSEFPRTAISRSLKIAGLAADEIDAIAISIKADHKWPQKVLYGLRNLKKAPVFYRSEFVRGYFQQRDFWKWYRSQYDGHPKKPKIHFIKHHLSHVAGSFFVSPYDHAALLSLDGSGEWATSYIGEGRGNAIKCFNQSYFPMSLGSFYEAVTEFCGFRPNYDEGKTMGLASFGDPSKYYKVVNDMVRVDDEGTISIDLSYFDYQYGGHQRCSRKFYQVFGPPKKKDEPFNETYCDVAAAFQKVLEEKALHFCRILRKRTKSDYLVVAGGVALNSVMNGKIVRESEFKDVYVMPAAGDNGTAIGAAYYLYNYILKKDRGYVHMDPYVGTEYSDNEILQTIKDCKLKSVRHDDILDIAAKYLNDGKILGWFQGKMEIGPRALGNRSILANPCLPDMKDKINAEVKHREAFRPFAPSAPEEVVTEYFDQTVKDPFMLKVCNVLKDKQALLPAITHVDGTARLQTVHKDTNPLYHQLIHRFGDYSGVPVILNTSFNIQGEPIVESPLHAIRCFFSTGIDILIMGHYVIEK